jgi:hypothetical protein
MPLSFLFGSVKDKTEKPRRQAQTPKSTNSSLSSRDSRKCVPYLIILNSPVRIWKTAQKAGFNRDAWTEKNDLVRKNKLTVTRGTAIPAELTDGGPDLRDCGGWEL